MKILYLDCFSGISGDMALAALVDAGADIQYIEQELTKLGIQESYQLVWHKVMKSGISSLKVDVQLELPDKPSRFRVIEHSHRRHADIVKMIRAAGLSAAATHWSLAIFEKIAIAEAKIHQIPIEEVHFHEVGAIDSIVDIVGVSLALDHLQPDRIISSPIPLGSGTIRIDHGTYPVPAPATLEMMRGIPIAPSQHTMELTTPTGAGIIAGIVDEFSSTIPPMIVDRIGYGAGTRDLPNQPNVLRTVVGQMEPSMI